MSMTPWTNAVECYPMLIKSVAEAEAKRGLRTTLCGEFAEVEIQQAGIRKRSTT